MSEWKNPNFRDDDWQRWTSPQVEKEERPDIALVVRGVMGFILLVSVNAFALFAFTNLLGFSVSYRNSTLASVVFVMWRVYDIVVFRKIRNKD